MHRAIVSTLNDPYDYPTQPRRKTVRFCGVLMVVPAVLFLTSCASSIVTRHIMPTATPPVAEDEGIHYFLPKTIVRASVPVTEITKSPGPYAKVARYFFPDAPSSSIIVSESRSYTIDPTSVTITTRGVKDLTQQYVLKPTGQIFADTRFHFVMSDEGVPNQIRGEIDNKSVDVALTVLESTAKLAGKVLTGGALSQTDKVAAPRPAAQTCPNDISDEESYNKLSPRLQKLYCYLSSDDRAAVFTKEPNYANVLANYLKSELDSVSATRRDALRTEAVHEKIVQFLGARALYSELVQIVGASATILSQDINQVNEATFKARMDSRQARLKEIIGKFFGETKKDPAFWAGSFDFDLTPAQASVTLPMFTLKKETGICAIEVDDAVRRLASPRVETQSSCGSAVRRIQLLIAPIEPVVAAAVPAGSTKSGLRYRIPRSATITIADAASELARQNVSIAQFGQVASLPKKMGGWKTQYDVKFDANTGTLLDINVGNSAVIDSDVVKRAAGIADTGIGIKQKLDVQDAPVTAQQKAEKDRKLKEEQLRILLLENCLQDPTQPGCADLVKP